MNQKKTSPYLSRYERVKVISVRAQQLSVGKQPQIKVGANTNYINISLQELKDKQIPNNIIRKLPDKSIEIWAAKDLINLYD